MHLANVAPEFTGNWFGYLIQGGSFVALVLGGYVFARWTIAKDKRTEERMDAKDAAHAHAITDLTARHAAALQVCSDHCTKEMAEITAAFDVTRKTFTDEMQRYRDERNTREEALVKRLDLRDRQIMQILAGKRPDGVGPPTDV